MNLAEALEFCASADAAPAAPGAYLLQIDLAETLLVRMAGNSCAELSAGRYFYCGPRAHGVTGWFNDAAEHVQQRRLPRSVGADQPDDFAGRRTEAHVPQCNRPSETLGQCVNLEHRFLARGHPISLFPGHANIRSVADVIHSAAETGKFSKKNREGNERRWPESAIDAGLR